MGGALRRPLGASALHQIVIFETSGCGSTTRSQMSQLTVTHPILFRFGDILPDGTR